mgnify:CR=1 FL=1
MHKDVYSLKIHDEFKLSTQILQLDQEDPRKWAILAKYGIK